MPERNSTILFCQIAVIMLTLCAALFKIEDNFLLSGLLLLTVVYTCNGLDFRVWNTLDWTIGLFFLYNICTPLLSANIYPSLLTSCMATEAFLVYSLQREITKYKGITHLQQLIFVVICIIALCISFLSFYIFAKEASNAGFEKISDFRHLFRPFGYNTNVWNTVLFLMLGLVACMLTNRITRSVISFFILLSIVLSFSRSAYIVTIVYVILNLSIVKHRKYNIELTVAIAAALCIGMIFFSEEVITTIGMFDTESQRRSVEGRLTALGELWSVCKEHLLLGYGAGNFTLALDSFYGQDFTRTYTSYAPNILMKIMVERGLFGLVAFVGIIVLTSIQCWKNRHDYITSIAGITLLVTILKEMSLSVVSTMHFGWSATAVLLASISRTNKEVVCPFTSKSRRIIMSVICTLSLVPSSLWGITNKNVAPSELDVQKQFISALNLYSKGHDTLAKEILDSLVFKYPRNAQFGYQLYKIAYESGDKAKAFEYLTNSIKIVPRILTLREVKLLMRTDSIYYRNMREDLLRVSGQKLLDPVLSARYGMLAYLLGDKSRAMSHINYSLKVLPNMPIPWLVRGILLKENGRDAEAEECIHKYIWLTRGFSMKNPIERFEIPILTESDLWALYLMKYNEWYGKKIKVDYYVSDKHHNT